MSWKLELREILRVMVGDFDATKYANATLERVLAVAAFTVAAEQLDFTQDYSVNVVTKTITPDPSAEATRDDSFINLVCMKAACIIDQGSAANAAAQAIAVKDGSSAVDLRGILQGKLALLDKSWCAHYEDAKFEHQLEQSRVAGAAVMTPFRLYAYGTSHGAHHYRELF